MIAGRDLRPVLRVAKFRDMSEAHHAWTADIPGQARRLLLVEGPDAPRFLQGLLTQDVDALEVGQARGACLLTVKGKISFDLAVARRGDTSFWLALPAEQAQACMEKLDKHLIMDDVELAWGENEVGVAWGKPASFEPDFETFDTTYPVRGQLFVGARDKLASGTPNAADAFAAHRVSVGLPASGHEVVPGRFPPEVGFVDAVSYTKGCFMGQEPLSRLHSRGQSNWVMVRVALGERGAESVLPEDLSAEGRPNAGQWTTRARVGERDQGLAVIHRKLAQPGQQLQGASGTTLEVTSLPLGEDAGVAAAKGARVALGKKPG
jgi:folate-binding protein YgfZ